MLKRTFNYFKRDKAIPSPAGCRFQKQNTIIRDGNNLTLKEVATIDTQELIESYVDGVSLDKMIARFRRGDSSALERKRAFYADTSSMSTDLREVIENGRAATSVINGMSTTELTTEPTSVPTIEPTNEGE